ncbi:response regulator transcription factor [Streptomyces sp. NPDC091268]|uniref:response regulator transcription factor n=1 Tax=Streptomyces sp. NPDC091268 TaxID=3365979 RepID=UPI0038009B17
MQLSERPAAVPVRAALPVVGEIAYALGSLRISSTMLKNRTGPTPHPGLGDLTPREREVLGLVGAGLSHADIAARLVLSAATVTTHVHRCMSKPGLAGRAQAAAVAHEFALAVRRP